MIDIPQVICCPYVNQLAKLVRKARPQRQVLRKRRGNPAVRHYSALEINLVSTEQLKYERIFYIATKHC